MNSRSSANEVFIVGAARTPTGRFNGALASQQATELGALAVQAAVERSGVDPQTIYEVIMGQVICAGSGQAPARQAALGAGLPNTVGASSVNKVCGSGLKAVMLAANAIIAGEAGVFVAGGMENMSNAPYLLPRARQGLRFGHAEVEDALITDGLWCAFQEWQMGEAAEFIAQQFEVSREEMDTYALESHRKAAVATASGFFADEIVPVRTKQRRKLQIVARDEPIRADFENGHFQLTTSLDGLANLRPAFSAEGQVTAGNAPSLNDGAAALVIAGAGEAVAQSLPALARIVGFTHVAVDPQWIFSAPARAIPRLLKKVGWSLEDVDLMELNEAFAAQVLANAVDLRRQGFDWQWDKVNVNGGAIALGHPLGASGARVLVTLLFALRQRGLQRGVAALCLGGGEAVAMAIECVD